MSEIETYAKTNLAAEILIIDGTDRKNEYPQLTAYEKAVIYKYSDDGFKDINEELRKSKGKNFSDFARHLNIALKQLPGYDGLVYRKVHLTKQELTRYRNALKNNNPLKEFPFTSTTKSRLIAMNFAGTTTYTPNCLFRIQTKTGKEIDKIAKFDEKEVLLLPNTIYSVLEVRKEIDYTLITMEEI
jgi:hypothetical protein